MNLCVVILCVLPIAIANAEIKIFEKEVEEVVGRDQSQEQVEAFALQKAKRLAVEDAGTYISSLSVVQNYQLTKYETTALASGVVQAKIVGTPSAEVKDGAVHIRVKSRIQVDTSVLDRQIEEILKEKGTLKKLEEERQKVKELENELANVKGSELRRLEELNVQAIALERERDRQRLFREEQGLKARGELKKSEIERLQKERDMQTRINQTIAEQEKARRAEADAIAKEQDRIKRAQLENEQRWNELVRRSQLAQKEWIIIDDSLSLKQAMEEVKQLKAEIASLKSRLDFQFQESEKNLKNAFDQQVALSIPDIPPKPAEKDSFETQAEYSKRLADYEKKVSLAEGRNATVIKKIKLEEDFRLIQTKREYFEQTMKVLQPFMDRLQSLQQKKFILPDGAMTVELKDPDPENSRFPIVFRFKDQTWNAFWKYADREKAKDFWRTRTYLKAQGLFQLEEKVDVNFKLCAAKVSHPGTGEEREFILERPKIFSELGMIDKISQELPEIRKKERLAEIACERGFVFNSFKDNPRFLISEDSIIWDKEDGLEWFVGPNREMNWDEAKAWVESLKVDGGGWRLPTIRELQGTRVIMQWRGGKSKRYGNEDSPIILTDSWVWSGEALPENSRLNATNQYLRRFKYYYFDQGIIGSTYAESGTNLRVFAVRKAKSIISNQPTNKITDFNGTWEIFACAAKQYQTIEIKQEGRKITGKNLIVGNSLYGEFDGSTLNINYLFDARRLANWKNNPPPMSVINDLIGKVETKYIFRCSGKS